MSDLLTKTAGKLDILKAMIGPLIGGGIELGATVRSANQSGAPIDPITALTAAAAGGYSGYRWQHMTGGKNKAEIAQNVGKNLGVTIGDLMLPRGVDAFQTARQSMSLNNQIKQQELAKGSRPAPAPVAVSNSSTMMSPEAAKLLGGSIVGAGALYALSNFLKSKQSQPPSVIQQIAPPASDVASPQGSPAGLESSAGTLRVTLPTRKANDQETQVEIPLERIGLSNALMNKIKRDTKRRLRSESDSRTHRILPAVIDSEAIKVACASNTDDRSALQKDAATPYGYAGIGAQQYLPIHTKRELSPQEIKEVEEAKSRILPVFFPSDSDSMSTQINSPLLRTLLYGGGGALAGGALGSRIGNSPTATAIGAGVGALLGGGLGFFSKQQENRNVEDAMTRLPEGATTLRDMESDPVHQARRERASARDNAIMMASMLARR